MTTVVGMPHYKRGRRDPIPPPSAATRLSKSLQAEITRKREAAPLPIAEEKGVATPPDIPPVSGGYTPIAGLLMAPFQLGPGSYKPIPQYILIQRQIRALNKLARKLHAIGKQLPRTIASGPVIAMPASFGAPADHMSVAECFERIAKGERLQAWYYDNGTHLRGFCSLVPITAIRRSQHDGCYLLTSPEKRVQETGPRHALWVKKEIPTAAPVALLSTWTASRVAVSTRVRAAMRRSGLTILPTGDPILLPDFLNPPPEPAPEPVAPFTFTVGIPGEISPSDRCTIQALLTSLAAATSAYTLGKQTEAELINHLSGYVKLARTLGNQHTRGPLTRFDRAATEARIAADETPAAKKKRQPSAERRAIADADRKTFLKSAIANPNKADRERQREADEIQNALSKADHGRRLARLVERLTGVILVDPSGSMTVAGDFRYWLKATHTGADALLIERRGVRGPKEYEWLKSAEYTWNETTACREWLVWAEAEAKRKQAEQVGRAAALRAKYQAQIVAGGIP